ncbi:MAG TPA: glycosyltransferase family 39 protein [Gemmatimonadales bacterium]
MKGSANRRRTLSLHSAALFLLVALVSQALAGAFGPDITASPDDPSHFMSGLMVRDYLAHGLGEPPMAFARDYYSHYPKIAIGNWPPLFHVVQGVWLLVLPVSGASVFVLLAIMAAATAWLVFRATRPALGAPFALLGAIVFLLLRPVPHFTAMVMAEVPLTLASTIAALAWARYMAGGGTRRAAAFALCALLAVLIKANGLLLLLVPPLAAIIGGRWRVLRSRAFWGAALAVLVVVVPLLWFSLPIMRAGWASSHALLGDVGAASRYYLWGLLRRLGPVLAALAAWGAWTRLRGRPSGDVAAIALWSTAAAMVLATLAFHVAAPAGRDLRHMIPAHPFIAMFVAAGARELCGALRRVLRHEVAATAVAVAIAAAALSLESFPIHDSHLRGFGAAAEMVVERAAARGTPADSAVVLVSSDATGEGAMVVEMALRDDSRPHDVVWRATKLLADVTWAGRDYTEQTADGEELLRLLDQASVEWVVIDHSSERFPHQRSLREAVAAHPDRFALVGVIPVRRDREDFPDGIRVYDFVRDTTSPADSLLRQVPGYEGIEWIARGG